MTAAGRSAPVAGARPPRCRSLTAMTVALAGLALVVVLTLLGVALWQKRSHTLADATRMTQNLARLLEANAIDAVHQADLVLFSLAELLQDQARRGPPSKEQIRQVLASRLRPWARYRELFVTDAAGRLVSNAGGEVPPLDLADRDYFTALRDDAAIDLYISQPFFSRVAATWSLVVSRRLTQPDGKFTGVVAAVIDLARFERFYASLDVGRNGNVTLWNGTATRVLARYPPDPTLLGESIHDPLAERRGAGQTYGSFVADSPLDGIERLLSFRRVGELPLVVSVALAKDAVLEGWAGEAKLDGIGAFVGAAGLLLLTGVVVQQFDRQRRLIAALTAGKAAQRASEERFRDFAETASDWYWETDAGHRFSYVSERIRTLGLEPEQMIGKRRTDLTLDTDEDEAKWRAHLGCLARHEPFTNFVYRYRVGEGGARYSCTSGRPLFDRTGRFLGYRGTGRDVSAQVAAGLPPAWPT
ncbi:MAG TPA: cache domain-containing protein [Stellaceae bacterium]|nr:cache domain-containing protein [Stellaceae bacterium]